MTRLFCLALCLGFAPLCARAEPVSIAITDAANMPVAGALVQVENLTVDDNDRTKQTLSQSLSDAAGIARFDLKARAETTDYFGRATAFKSGLALGGTELRGAQSAIRLLAPAPLTGVVKDAAGAPVAGARVGLQVLQLQSDQSSLVFFEEGARAFADIIQSQTDDKGAWKLDAIPPAFAEIWLIVSAPGYATQKVELAESTPQTTVLAPEARLTGRVLAPDGTPLDGVKITPIQKDGDQLESVTTDAQGRFRATGLGAGLWLFAVDLGERPFLLGDDTKLEVQVGDNVLPDITVQNGVVVRGTVRETDGTPVKAWVTYNLPGQIMTQRARVNDKGEFAARVPAGERTFALQTYSNKYKDSGEPKTLQVGLDTAPDLSWTLQRAPVLRGVVVDEKGAPIAANFIVAKTRFGSSVSFSSDENGRFEAPVVFEGEVNIKGDVGKNGQFEVVGDSRVVLPEKSELKLVVRPAKPTFLRASAVDSAGAPLADVAFEAMVNRPNAGSFLRLRSDENGEIRSENLGTESTLQSPLASKKGYALRAPIEVVRDGDDWTAKLVFDRRDIAVRGTILDAAGQPAAGARILAGGVETRSDAQGAWALNDLPPGVLTIAAIGADGQGIASAQSTLAAPLQLRAATLVERDMALARAIIDELRAEPKPPATRRLQNLELPTGQDFVERVRAAEAEPRNSPVRLFYVLVNQSNARKIGDLEAVSTADIVRGFLAMSQADDRLSAAAALMEARPDWKDAPGANDFVFQLEADVERELANPGAKDAMFRAEGVFALPAALETLGQTESADRAFKAAVDWAWKFDPNNGELGREAILTRGIGAYGRAPRLFDKLLNYFDPESYWHHRALAEVVAPTARARGLQAAQNHIETLKGLPDSRPAPVQGDEMPYSIKNNLPYVIENAIRAGGQSDPPLALRLASGLPTSSNQWANQARGRALIEAAFWQTPAAAAQIWRAQVPQLDPAEAVETAAQILESSPANATVAAELYQNARARLDATEPDTITRFTAQSGRDADFARYEAQFAPANALYRLEKAWPSALKENSFYQLQRYIMAMARVNPQRALEMARQVPTDENSFAMRLELARWLAGGRED